MDTAKNPLTLTTMIETLLMDGYVLQYEKAGGVFVAAKPETNEIHFNKNFLETVRDPFFGPKELRNPRDPRMRGLSSEVTGINTDVVVKSHSLEKTCGACGHVSRRYKISFSLVHLRIARTLFEYCVNNKTYMVTKKDLAPFMSHTAYGNFYTLQRFGLIYYIKDENGKTKRGSWGVPLKRLYKFLHNEATVAEFFWRDKDESTNMLSEKRIYLMDIPNHGEILDETMLPTFLEFETDSYFDYQQ